MESPASSESSATKAPIQGTNWGRPWLVEANSGNEIKLTYEFMSAILRAAGGTIVFTDADVVAIRGESIEFYRTPDGRFKLTLKEGT